MPDAERRRRPRKTSFVKRMNPKTAEAELFPGADPTNPFVPEDPTRPDELNKGRRPAQGTGKFAAPSAPFSENVS
jgi:hypothetical protein